MQHRAILTDKCLTDAFIWCKLIYEGRHTVSGSRSDGNREWEGYNYETAYQISDGDNAAIDHDSYVRMSGKQQAGG